MDSEEHTVVNGNIPNDVDLEDAMDLAGTGKYQVFHGCLMLATLSTSLLEIISYAFLLPAAACDLDMPEELRGVLTSIPNIGIIITAPFWGRAADSLGRKPMLLLSTAAAGTIGLVAAFMPNLISFAVCKFAGSLFLSCPSSLGFAYTGEMVPRKRRDIAVLFCNGLLTLSSALTPLLAWGVLSSDWSLNLGFLVFRPWRLLTMVYAMPLLLTAVWMTQAKESPKFLMAKGKRQEALEVLKHIYWKNTGFSRDSFPVKSLKKSQEHSEEDNNNINSQTNLDRRHKKETAIALILPPHVKWFALLSFLMFGLYTSLNGLFLFAADTINKVLREPSEQIGTLCVLMNQSENQTRSDNCKDDISQDTFLIMVVTTTVFGVIVLGASLSPLSKKTLLVSMYLTTGVSCLLSGLLTNRVVAGIAMSALQLTALGIGPLTAYAVQLFPTTLRGTAVGAILMFGRVGSVIGANVAGFLLTVSCTAAFYGFAALIFVCAALCFLLANDQESKADNGIIIAEDER